MKKEFYYVDDLNVYIRLSSIVTFLSKGAFANSELKDYRCCIVIHSETVYWCDKKHFEKLKEIFELK
jgi:hypothetical protein